MLKKIEGLARIRVLQQIFPIPTHPSNSFSHSSNLKCGWHISSTNIILFELVLTICKVFHLENKKDKGRKGKKKCNELLKFEEAARVHY